MAMVIIDHHLKEFFAWFAIFSKEGVPEIGSWKMVRGIDDPNRVYVIGEGI